jgi:very-short-patch-repair endonuclease
MNGKRQGLSLPFGLSIVLRYWEHEIEEDASKVSEAVRTVLKNRQ